MNRMYGKVLLVVNKVKKILLISLIFLMLGCTRYELTLDKFLEIGSFNGYIMEENKKGYEKYAYINKIYYAINRDNAYDIQFMELENEDYAKKFFEINQKNLMTKEGKDTYVKRKNKSYYNLYHLEDMEKYYLVIRCDNNLLYVEAPIGYLLEIEEFLEELHLEY